MVDRGAGPERVAALRVEVLQKGEQPWLPQFYHRGIELQAGRSYRLRVWLKADRRRTVSARVTLSHAPWTIIWEERLTLSDDWQQVERVFRGVLTP